MCLGSSMEVILVVEAVVIVVVSVAIVVEVVAVVILCSISAIESASDSSIKYLQ